MTTFLNNDNGKKTKDVVFDSKKSLFMEGLEHANNPALSNSGILPQANREIGVPGDELSDKIDFHQHNDSPCPQSQMIIKKIPQQKMLPIQSTCDKVGNILQEFGVIFRYI